MTMRAERDPTTIRCGLIGGTGFLGRHLAEALDAQGVTVGSFGRGEVDLADAGSIAALIRSRKLTDIIHLAAHSDPTAPDWRQFYEVNAHSTLNCLRAAEVVQLKGRFIYVSATSVYGAAHSFPTPEETPPAPLNHYGASKVLGETYCAWFRDRLDVAVARPSNCFGRGQSPQYLPAKLVAAYAARADEITLGDTSIARDFVDVRDAADIFRRLLLARNAPTVMNVASGRATPIRSLLETLGQLTGHSPRIRRSDALIRAGDMTYQACDIARARALGHRPRHSLADTLEWMLADAATGRAAAPGSQQVA